MIVVPVVNPDGFNASREAGELQGGGGAPATRTATAGTDESSEHRLSPERVQAQELPLLDGRRRHLPRRASGGSPGRASTRTATTAASGAAAARARPARRDLLGHGPFSEPETQNVRDLVSTRQVTTLITNHTYSDLVLRPPGVKSQGRPPTSRSTRRSATRWPRRTATRASTARSCTTRPARPRTGVQRDRRSRLHVRDRRARASTAPASTRRGPWACGRVLRARARLRQGQPRGVLHRARERGQPGDALGHHRQGAAWSHAAAVEDVHDADARRRTAVSRSRSDHS